FVAMLGLQLPALFFYDALVTLISALVAILITGVALLLMHFRQRTPRTITLAGALLGIGITAMHYIGMSAMEVCRPVYSPPGIAGAAVASVALSVGAMWIAYGKRTHRNILLGTLGFGGAVVAVHFIAMAGTGFRKLNGAVAGPVVDNPTLALVVTVVAFLICGAFLLTGITFFPAEEEDAPAQPAPAPDRLHQIPYEKDGRTLFVDVSAVAAIRAEGHYTLLYSGEEKLFCPWSISEAEGRLPPDVILRTHRSYLINPAHVSSFERTKDNGICYFDRTPALPKVPVSRSRLAEVRAALGV
ncbi:MAG: MHYT domain-containing protein, partial [Pseudomonadota bacterium]